MTDGRLIAMSEQPYLPPTPRPLLARARRNLRNAAGFTLIWVTSKVPHGVTYTRSAAIPRTGPAILVANHLSTTEALALARLTTGHRRFPHFLAMQEVFTWPGIGQLARATGQIPVRRGSANAAGALDLAADRLRLGQVVVLYPEGRLTRQPDLRPGSGKTGAARLALGHPDVPVIPIGMWGPRPGKRHMWHRHTARMSIGAPVDLTPWCGRIDQAAAQEATVAIMSAITEQVEAARGAPFSSAPRP